jgi:subfamily B ATP-binding cassette protein MsbA
MRKFWPYFSLLRGARAKFVAGIGAGLLYALASGFGLPFMIKTVFPIIFQSQKPAQEEVVAEAEPAESADSAELLPQALADPMAALEDKDRVRAFFVERCGEERAHDVMVLVACLMIPLVAATRSLAGFFNVYWISAAGLHVLLQIQQSVFVKLQKLPLGFFSGRRTGDLMSRVINDTVMLQNTLSTLANDLIKQPFTLVFALIFLVVDCYRNSETIFLIICLASIPLVVLPIRLISRRLMQRAASMQSKSGDNSAILAETLGATREIRAFNLENLMANRFLDGIRKWTSLHLKVIRYRTSTPLMIEFIAAAAVASALAYGANEGLSLERFIAVVAALYMCYEPAKKLGSVHNQLRQGEASLDRLETILHADEGVTSPAEPVAMPELTGRLCFEGVNFSYSDRPALNEVSIEIPAGQIVALVGPSGAGKTTFASMVPRFYDPRQGQVTLDGIDLRQFDLKELRDHITLVPQEAILLSGTIADNIRLGRLDASDEEVRRAAELANADSFIRQKEMGYETPVGERGAELSGGQRQRISIARAFLKNAPVLILDEATASLDSESEAQIQNELANLARGRTTLIIAHRFSSIQIADRILVFDEGRIVGDGTFGELAAGHDLFRKLLARQQSTGES